MGAGNPGRFAATSWWSVLGSNRGPHHDALWNSYCLNIRFGKRNCVARDSRANVGQAPSNCGEMSFGDRTRASNPLKLRGHLVHGKFCLFHSTESPASLASKMRPRAATGHQTRGSPSTSHLAYCRKAIKGGAQNVAHACLAISPRCTEGDLAIVGVSRI